MPITHEKTSWRKNNFLWDRYGPKAPMFILAMIILIVAAGVTINKVIQQDRLANTRRCAFVLNLAKTPQDSIATYKMYPNCL
jgi:hypothetical protein